MFYLAQAVYNDPLPCSRKALTEELIPAHAAYIRSGVDRGLVLLAGPKAEEDGGFVVLRAPDRETLDAFLAGDPLVVRRVQTFQVTPWRVLDYPPALAEMLGTEPGTF